MTHNNDAGHCHAPACKDIRLFRNDTGHEMELLCHQMPKYGQGNNTDPKTKEDKYDEAGYEHMHDSSTSCFFFFFWGGVNSRTLMGCTDPPPPPRQGVGSTPVNVLLVR